MKLTALLLCAAAALAQDGTVAYMMVPIMAADGQTAARVQFFCPGSYVADLIVDVGKDGLLTCGGSKYAISVISDPGTSYGFSLGPMAPSQGPLPPNPATGLTSTVDQN